MKETETELIDKLIKTLCFEKGFYSWKETDSADFKDNASTFMKAIKIARQLKKLRKND